ncbi:helix-turn-helix domain-containing protein [Rhodocaloribacter litoris]|uniref:helix-turn-helix domain-containing protein n=1 Tax=Rhodocaloribacter litoris TaxID=2558931 RepID=UPI001421B54F|nr:helix-turn-helix domain-containing protein [Rhodocaloribacter litoris]QXD14779.1 helix-turn-helix domain-containing protein [Rhodocaloribacter litoris]
MSALLQPEQVIALETMAREASDEALRRRARLLLLYHEGRPTREVAAAVGLSPSRANYWRREFRRRGMDVFPQTDAVPVKPATPPASRKRAPKTPAAEAEASLVDRVTDAIAETVPALLPKKLRKKAEKLAGEVRDILGKKAARAIEEIRTEESFRAFVDFVQKQGAQIREKLEAEDLKKKQIKFLRKQLKKLEAQIERAEKLLQKMESR